MIIIFFISWLLLLHQAKQNRSVYSINVKIYHLTVAILLAIMWCMFAVFCFCISPKQSTVYNTKILPAHTVQYSRLLINIITGCCVFSTGTGSTVRTVYSIVYKQSKHTRGDHHSRASWPSRSLFKLFDYILFGLISYCTFLLRWF